MRFDDSEFQEWLEAQTEGLEKLKESAVFCGMVSPDYLEDPLCMLQMGAAILMNKPIFLILMDDVKPPPKLFQIADKVVFASRTEESMARAAEEIREFILEREGEAE